MEQAVFTNMCMIYDDKGNILVQDRLDKNWPGITFPGGHVENGESFVESTIREVREETGLSISNLQLCGMKQWQTGEDARYVVLFFKTNCFEGELQSSEEGKVFWIKANEINNYNLANDFDKMFEIFINEKISEFYYYKNNENTYDIKLL
ncbi:8-oxo-dGTP diphosphatase [Sedimentibacter sp. zth1]|uniref:8-oxo-dGTP diphosphatase n=1 Tax=Sedimentibacter sp. zth1 TaxID=2816908 RepID=UPI001A920967|nr:8-oxo-dGTP diphosphatase [Sedimentibacter sp. zth1]QSX06100.1 8-oxo-dGTP diphosphatase [Sedimentibacter sp. zth1]